ncbi:amy, partial [Symbiodinium sp. CCMP2456]
MPCVGWGGSRYGNRMQQGAKGWDAASPRHFHHKKDDAMEPWCQVGPQTGWLCPDDDCTPCDMYALPDFATELEEVRELQVKHLEDLFHIGVTALRVDAAIYHHVYELAAMVNRLPWDLVYQEWWGEYPPHDRTEYVGLYRDVAYRWHLVNRLAGKNATELPELLQLESGVFGITQDMAVYPFAYHDGRSKDSDPEIATYKNGLAFHQQQKFFLSWPFGEKVLIWGGYGWRDLTHGPPGCDKSDGDHCTPDAVYDEDGHAQCMPAPTVSPLPKSAARERRWICEHRWQGVAGMMHFRKACRQHAVSEKWEGGKTEGIGIGRLAFRLRSDCFVALTRGRREDEDEDVAGVGGTWDLTGLKIGLPQGRYCDMSSLHTQKGWDQSSCPREVEVDEEGVIQHGSVTQGAAKLQCTIHSPFFDPG